MNVLFCNFDEEWHNEIIGRTAQKIGADKLVSMSVRDHDLDAYVSDNCWIDSRDFNQKKYTFMADKDLPTLDTELLDKMRWCEALYYPMLDRTEVEKLISISYQDRKRYYENDVRCMLWILEHHKIELCVFSTIPHISFDYALYGLCKTLGIPVVIAYFGVTVPHRTASAFCMTDIFDPMPQMRTFQPSGRNEEDIQLPQRMQHYMDHYGRDKSQIKSFVNYSDYIKKSRSSKMKKMVKLVQKKLQDGDFVVSVRKKISQYFMGKRIGKYLAQHSEMSAEGKYIYYPLHYQPECTSLPMGGVFYDQLHVIRMISRYLPDDVTLYVKPHPKRNLFSDVPFYEQIRALRNVKLLSSKSNTYESIDNALAVVSLTGTAILESLVRGTPAMMFGHYVWQYAPNVFHCMNNEDCEHAVNTLCAGYQYDRAAFKDYLCLLDQQLTDGTLYSVLLDLYPIEMDKNIENLTNCLVTYIQNKTWEKKYL